MENFTLFWLPACLEDASQLTVLLSLTDSELDAVFHNLAWLVRVEALNQSHVLHQIVQDLFITCLVHGNAELTLSMDCLKDRLKGVLEPVSLGHEIGLAAELDHSHLIFTLKHANQALTSVSIGALLSES